MKIKRNKKLKKTPARQNISKDNYDKDDSNIIYDRNYREINKVKTKRYKMTQYLKIIYRKSNKSRIPHNSLLLVKTK